MRNIIIACGVMAFLSCCSVNKKTIDKGISGMPPCLVTKIDLMKNDAKQKPPESVTQFDYKGKTVFYVVMPCCDQFNVVYDSDCNYLGAPDGGITGKGDGKIGDFSAEAKNKKIVWENK